MGGPVHSRSRSGNWQGHHQERSRQDAGRGQGKAEESHRGKRRHRLRTGQDLHRGKLAGGLDGELRQVKLRPSTFKTSQGFLKNHIKPQIGSVPLADLTSLDLQRFYKHLLDGGRVDRIEAKKKPKGWLQNRAEHPPDDRLGVQPRHEQHLVTQNPHRAAPCRKSNTRNENADR